MVLSSTEGMADREVEGPVRWSFIEPTVRQLLPFSTAGLMGKLHLQVNGAKL